MYICVCPVHKNPPDFAKRTFLSPWLQWQQVYTMGCVRRWPGLCLGLWPCFRVFAVSVLCRLFSPDILELWLFWCIRTGQILPPTHVLYLSGPSILSPAPVFRERPMWEPVSLHFFWWFILARLVLTFRIITPPVMSNELGQFSDRRHLSDISLLLLKKCSDFCGLGPLHRHCCNTKT